MRKFGKNADEQLKLERARFKSSTRHKPVLAEQIKSREMRELKKQRERQETGQEKIFVGDII